MKQINNVTKEGVELLRQVVQNAPSGMDIGQLRGRMKILDALDTLPTDASSMTVVLEDADHARLQQCFNEAKFVRVEKWLVDLADGVANPVTPQ